MKPYPVSPLPAAAADDPESTAELPVIDSADYEPEARTDAWSVPATEYPTPVAADDAEAATPQIADCQEILSVIMSGKVTDWI